MAKVKMRVSELPKDLKYTAKICPEWAKIELYSKYGGYHKTFVGAPLGSSMNPLSEEMLYSKFLACVKFSKMKLDIKSSYEKLLNIEKINNCQQLF